MANRAPIWITSGSFGLSAARATDVITRRAAVNAAPVSLSMSFLPHASSFTGHIFLHLALESYPPLGLHASEKRPQFQALRASHASSSLCELQCDVGIDRYGPFGILSQPEL